MDRRGFVRLAGVIIGMAGVGSKNVLGDSDFDPAATPPNSEQSPIRGNSLSSVAEPVPLEPDDIQEVTETRDDGEDVTYWVVRHGIEYDRAIYREPARLGGSNFELGGSDTGSFWFGIAGSDLERIPHQGQVTLYFRVGNEDEDSASSASPGRGRGNNGNGSGDDEDVDTEAEEEDGDENDAEWVYLKAQFTAGRKDELLHVNGVKLDSDGPEDGDEDKEEADEGEEEESGDGDADDGDEDGQDDENGDVDEEGEDEEDGDGDVDDEDGDQESLGSSEVSRGPEGGNRPPDAKDRLHAVLDRILREL